MDMEKTGKRLARISRLMFWLIGLCGLASIIVGISQDSMALIAGGLLMICAAPGGEIVNSKLQK